MAFNQRIKDALTGAITATLIVGIVPAAFATVSQMDIQVSYNDIKIVLDGKELKTEGEPFAYNGTTYLPVRAVAEAVGKEVLWDATTKTVYLGQAPDAKSPVADTKQPAIKAPESTPPVQEAAKGTYSRTNPAPIGTAQTIKISDYSNEYTATVTILSAERGATAWSKIKEANQFNSEAPEGKEYVLAKVKMAVSNVKDDKAVSTSEHMFDVFSSSNTEHEIPMVICPAPEFTGDIYSGSSKEGYVAFLVDKSDAKPKIVFGRDYQGSGGIWFNIQ